MEKLEYLYNKLIKTKKFNETIEARFCFFLIFYDKGVLKNALEIAESFRRNISRVTEALKGKPRFNSIELYRILGDCYYSNGMKEKAKSYYQKYLEKIDKTISSKDRQDNILGLANLVIPYDMKQSKNIVSLLKREIGTIIDTNVRNRVYWAIGDFYFESRQYENAKLYYEKAYRDSKSSKINKTISYFAVAVCEKNLEYLSSALKNLKKASFYNNNESVDLELKGKIEKEKALIFFRKFKKRKDIEYFIKAKKIFIEIGDKKELLATLFNICRYYKYYENDKEYDLNYKKILEIEVKDTEMKKRILDKLDKI